MISIGGIIGAGVFVGSSAAIATIGPAVVLSYLFAGIVVYAVIRILARMAMDQPGLGSFTEYVRAGLGNGAGFITGWLYWWFWVVVVAIEAHRRRAGPSRPGCPCSRSGRSALG